MIVSTFEQMCKYCFSPHEASVSVSGLHVVAVPVASVVCEACAEGLPLLLLDLDSLGAGLCLDAVGVNMQIC